MAWRLYLSSGTDSEGSLTLEEQEALTKPASLIVSAVVGDDVAPEQRSPLISCWAKQWGSPDDGRFSQWLWRGAGRIMSCYCNLQDPCRAKSYMVSEIVTKLVVLAVEVVSGANDLLLSGAQLIADLQIGAFDEQFVATTVAVVSLASKVSDWGSLVTKCSESMMTSWKR